MSLLCKLIHRKIHKVKVNKRRLYPKDLDVYKQKDVDDNDPCIKITFLILNKNHGVEIHWMDDDTSGNNNLLKIIFQ